MATTALTDKQRAAVALAKKTSLVFAAPENWKNGAYVFRFVIDKDGLPAPGMSLMRVKGRWDNPEAKQFSMAEIDPITFNAFVARFTAGIFAVNLGKRMPTGSYQVIYTASQVGSNAELVQAEKRIAVKCQQIVMVRMAQGKRQKIELSKEFIDKLEESKGKESETYIKFSTTYRKLRAGAKLLSGAFTQLAPLPSGRAVKV
jgi:hypothetical protein